jgi:prostaglandin-endoperoxide synthase 2
MEAEKNTLNLGRQFRLQSFNQYRRRWGMKPYRSFEEFTDDRTLAQELRSLYPDTAGKPGIDRLELVIGLLAERRRHDAIIGPLQLAMVGADAFSQALTNPLLANAIYGERAFSEYGVGQLGATSKFADIVKRNLGAGQEMPHAAFTRM